MARLSPRLPIVAAKACGWPRAALQRAAELVSRRRRRRAGRGRIARRARRNWEKLSAPSTRTISWTVSLVHSVLASRVGVRNAVSGELRLRIACNAELGNMNLTGKRALITGGTKGIGAAIAIDLARQGCDVADQRPQRRCSRRPQCSRRSRRPAASASRSSPTWPGRTTSIDCVREAETGLGGLDILVHSAGGPSLGTIDDCSPEQWKATFDVHVHAAYFLCRRALPTMRKAGEGAIILISSVAGIRGVPESHRLRHGEGRDPAVHADASPATRRTTTSASIASPPASSARGSTTR